jgi:acetyltransferase-like isoleucine patch superfamily enzyme
MDGDKTMENETKIGTVRSVMPSVHTTLPINPDPVHEIELSRHFRATMSPGAIAELYGRFSAGHGEIDAMMRRVIWRALAQSFGNSVRIAPQAMFRHLSRVSIGDGVFIGEAALVQGHIHGDCRIADRAWIGPMAFLDARALVIENSAAIAPGAKILTAEHTGLPIDLPVNATEQAVGPVHVGAGADVGVGAVVLPGCKIGRGAIIGAGSVVTEDVPDNAIAAGVPARVMRYRGDLRESRCK